MGLWLVSNALAAEPVLRPYDTGILDRGLSLLGILVFLLIGLSGSKKPHSVKDRTIQPPAL